jgi:long-chain acyl-CoA synthetase
MGGGGAQIPPDLVDKIEKKLKNGRPGTGYGMTEVSGIITAITKDYFVANPESVGPVLPIFDTKIIDTDGNEVPQGELGEICVKGAAVIKGYLNQPEATADTIRDGWLHTGDIAKMDEFGFVYIMDRAKDMLLRGGENVYCAEVESVLYKLDGIAECAVFGVPDERLGEEVGVAIYLEPNTEVTADDIRAHCKSLMAAYKSPRYIWMMDEHLPRNASGKFLKRELRDILELENAEA